MRKDYPCYNENNKRPQQSKLINGGKLMKILVTGGAGYIGSHTVVKLLENNYEVMIIDNFSNSSQEVLEQIKAITKKDFKFYLGDVCDKKLLAKIFEENNIDAVIHFAGYKAVGESVAQPLKYFRNNIDSTLSLLEVMSDFNIKKIVFSSSATVYEESKELPLKESHPLGCTNPYGRTKLMIENILQDLYIADNSWGIALLRYFNPIGAHSSGLIGENPNGIPNNLMPYIVKVAMDDLECLSVYGDDYNTPDGTGVRDYIHVEDLAEGHVKAIQYIIENTGIDTYNLGTGIGYSVLDVITAFEKANNLKINYKIVPRRPGDIGAFYADSSYAKQKLNFAATKSLGDMCKDAYNYAKKQP